MSKKPLSCVVLAAGQGTRMKSSIPKVLHKLHSIPMIKYVMSSVERLKPETIIVVVGRDNESAIKEALSSEGTIFSLQGVPLGTAHALLSTERQLKGFQGDILVINGDTPLISTATLKKFLTRHRRAKNSLSILSFVTDNPFGYGRILRDQLNKALKIKEEDDLTEEDQMIKEVNSGVYLFKNDAFSLVRSINLNKNKGEYYLTDILNIIYRKGLGCEAYHIGDKTEFFGINSKEDIFKAQELLREKIIKYWVEHDVGFMDERQVYIHPGVSIGKGTYIYPNVYLEGNTQIGSNCTIYPNVRVADSRIGDCVIIKDSSVIETSDISKGVIVGPFARVRPGTKILKNARIGNFVEVKASIVGKGTKIQHLSYIGDAQIGKNVNIGAGTITCNYDGVKKFRTIIEDEVFIGSNSELIAPVKIKKGAFVGAGSTVTKDVPPDSLVISRKGEKHILDWAKKRRDKIK